MVTDEDIEVSFEKQYKNEKRGRGISINKQLLIDYKIYCEELSRKTDKKITVSSRVRSLMYKDLLDSGRLNLIRA